MKKIVVLCCMFLIILLICFVVFKGHGSIKNFWDYNLEEVNQINYRVISENNKFGVINNNGDVLVLPLYDEIDIPNPSKPVFICMYNYNQEKNQYNIKVLNDKSEQILYQYFIVEAIKINPTISNIPYEKSVLKIKQNEKYGLIDFNGNVIVEPEYEEIDSFNYKEGLLLVKNNGKYGVINIDGEEVIKTKYDYIESDGYYEQSSGYKKVGFIVGENNNNSYKLGYINYKGEKILDIKYNQIERIYNSNENDDTYLIAFENEIAGFYKNNQNIIQHEYEDIIYDFNNNCLVLQKDAKQGISDLNGNVIIEIKYDNIYTSGKYVNAQNTGIVDVYDYQTKQKLELENIIAINEIKNSNYVIAITNEEKYKIIDVKNNKILLEKFDYLEHFYDEYFIASKNERFGIIDIEGKQLVKFKYENVIKISDNVVQCFFEKNNKMDLVIKNKIVSSAENSDIKLYDNYICVQSNKDRKYFNYNGDNINNIDILDVQLYASNQNGKWGFSNKNGEIIIKPEYDFVTEFNEFGFAGVCKKGKWGVINIKGDIIVQPYYEIESYSPNFIGKFYEVDLGYGLPYFSCESKK